MAMAEAPGAINPSAAAVAAGASRAVPLISPCAREALVTLIEVLTSVSKLPCKQSSDGCSSSNQHLGQRHQQLWHNVLSAWQAMCQPVAATVEHILRHVGAAAVHNAGAASAAATAAHKQRQYGWRICSAFPAACEFTTVYPTVVALGFCLAVMLSPSGRPGPLLVAAGLAAAAVDGSSPQLQLFALLVSEIKVLLSETSVKRELLTMHALEQAPLYMLKQIRLRQQQQQQQGVAAVDHRQGDSSAPLDCCEQSDGLLPQQQRRQCDQAARAAAVPWLLLLARLLMLRGQLLSEVLDQDLAASAQDERTQFSISHNTFWHIQMAEASASALEPYLQHINTSSCRLLLEHTGHSSCRSSW